MKITRMFAAAGLLAAVAAPAGARLGALPPTFGQSLVEADVVVIADVPVPPTWSGEQYDATPLRVLKGEVRAGTLVAVASHTVSCIISERRRAREAGAARLVLLVRTVDIEDLTLCVTLDVERLPTGAPGTPEGRAAARRVAHVADGVAALLALEDPECGAVRGASLWVEGLRSGNPWLAGRLLDRLDRATFSFGNDAPYAARLKEQARAAGEDLVDAVLELAGDRDPGVRERALRTVEYRWSHASSPDGRRERVEAVSRRAVHDDHPRVRTRALDLLHDVAPGDALRLALLRIAEPGRDRWERYGAVHLVARAVEYGEVALDRVAGVLVGAVDDAAIGDACAKSLRALTGLEHETPAAWREWWSRRPL